MALTFFPSSGCRSQFDPDLVDLVVALSGERSHFGIVFDSFF